MEFNIIIVLISFLIGAAFASPLAKRNRTEGLSERLKGTDFSRPEPVNCYRNDPRFALGPSLFAAPAIRNSSFVARRIIQKRPDTGEYESKFYHICQSGNKTEQEYKLPKPDDSIDVSLDKMEYSEHEEKTLAEVLLESLNKNLEESVKENHTGHTPIIENPKMMPYVWHDSLKLHTKEDKDEDKDNEEDDSQSESESESDSDDEEDAKKGFKKAFRMIKKRDDEKEEEEEEEEKKKKKKKPYLWPEHNRPKISKDGKFSYLYSSEGKQYAVATPQHLANETDRHEKAQQDKDQKLEIIQHELQKEMDAKLQQEHSRLKHENEMKFNASKPEKDEQIARI